MYVLYIFRYVLCFFASLKISLFNVRIITHIFSFIFLEDATLLCKELIKLSVIIRHINCIEWYLKMFMNEKDCIMVLC